MTKPSAEIKGFEYELIDIKWELDYDLTDAMHVRMVKDGSDEHKPVLPDIQYDENGIPKGNSPEEIQIRRAIIHDFIQNWRNEHPDELIINNSLKEPVKVLQVSLREACQHSARSYKSTKAVLLLERIIRDATKYGESLTKEGDSSQRQFEKMIILTYHSEELGLAKLTLGVKKQTHEKVEYGITVPDPNKPLIDSKLRIASKKKKTPHHRR